MAWLGWLLVAWLAGNGAFLVAWTLLPRPRSRDALARKVLARDA